MILYHAISSYQLIEVVLHKIIYNNNKKAILMISQDVTRRLSRYEKFKQFFFDIIVYDNGIGNYSILKGNGLHEYFDNFFIQSKYNLSSFETIYVACAHHSFGIYLCDNKYSFVMFEDGAGAISRPEILELVEEKFVNKNELAKKYGLYTGIGSQIIYCIYNSKFQKEGFHALNKWKSFDIAEALSNLNVEIRNSLIHIFTDINKICVSQKSALILTEHFANLRIFSWENQAALYQLLSDYFLFNYHLVFKPHPDDLMYYSDLFLDSTVINDKFPAEILPFLFVSTPDVVATISSTAIYGIQQCFKEKLEFNYDFSHKKRQFLHLHKYYVILDQIFFNKINKIYIFGVNKAIITNLCKFNGWICSEIIQLEDLKGNISENSAVIVDESPVHAARFSQQVSLFLEGLSESVQAYFVNSNEDYCFYHHHHKNLWKNFIPIEIVKKANRNKDIYLNLDTECVYLYMKGGNKSMKSIHEKELSNSGINISTVIPEDKDLKIKMLEGMLEATEKRLLYYIQKSSELEALDKE